MVDVAVFVWNADYCSMPFTDADPASHRVRLWARRVCVHFEYAFKDALNYAIAPGPFRGAEGRWRGHWGCLTRLVSESQLCCQAVSLLFIMFVPCPLIICPTGRRLCWPEAPHGQLRTLWYAVRRGTGVARVRGISKPTRGECGLCTWLRFLVCVPVNFKHCAGYGVAFVKFPLSRHLLVGIFDSAFKGWVSDVEGVFPPGILPSARFLFTCDGAPSSVGPGARVL